MFLKYSVQVQSHTAVFDSYPFSVRHPHAQIMHLIAFMEAMPQIHRYNIWSGFELVVYALTQHPQTLSQNTHKLTFTVTGRLGSAQADDVASTS